MAQKDSQANEENEVLIVPSRLGKDGNPQIATRLTLSDDVRPNVILPMPMTVIPVIFIPGIMGTNLQSDNNEIVWRPPNMDGVGAVLGAIGQLFAYFFRGPATRQKNLDSSKVKVDVRGEIGAENMSEELARARGWGGIMRSAYHPIMNRLQADLNNIMLKGDLMGLWATDNQRSPADYGDEKSGAALTQDQLKHAAHYRFDVWAGGYNWLQSNRDSGQDLIKFIDGTVLPFYGKNAQKVILVTHSMGGLVARAICNIHGYDKVLGVVHGVMPATGAAATYHHARCGYEGISSVILGRNAKEVVPVMGNSPGALELVPTADYKDGRPWLKLGDGDGALQLPLADPYEEIYKSRAWYGLVPAHNEALLDPAGTAAGSTNEPPSNIPRKSPTDKYDERIDEVQKFHEAISKKYPGPAYAHYSADSTKPSWETVHWQGASLGNSLLLAVARDNHNGELRLGSGGSVSTVRFAPASEPGDGTVPTTSGAAPGQTDVKASFRQGNQGKGAHNKLDKKGKVTGYEHQDSYNDPRAQWATLYSVIQIAQKADWHQ